MTTALEQSAGKERIAKALASLALARQASDFGDAAQRVYVHLLSDLDAGLVARACEFFARQPRAEYRSAMPSTGDIREQADAIQRADAHAEAQQYRALPPAGMERTYACFQCQDDPAGWLWLRCPETPCDRKQTHARHVYVVRCPHWLRQHEAELKLRAGKLSEKGVLKWPPDIEACYALEKGTYRYAQAVTQ